MTVEELLRPYSPRVRATVGRLRKLLVDWIPGVEERVLPGWRALAYRHAEAGHVCAVFPLEDDVKLYLEYGAEVADPRGLLEGDTRLTRFIRLRSPRAVRARELRPLVLGGLAAAVERRHHGRLRSRTRRSRP